MGSESALSRRALIAASLAAGVSPLVAGPAGARAPGPTWVPGAKRAPMIDPATELAPPTPPRTLRDVPKLTPADKRRLAPGRASQPGARAAEEPVDLPFDFRYDDFELRDLPPALRPYHMTTPVSLTDTGLTDAEGIRMYRRDGVIYNHPVAQAQYALGLMEAYRLTGIQEYLRRARKHAQRLIDLRVEHNGGWFYPYPFSFRLHGRYEVQEPPWYSMMAQGQVLSLLVRLTEISTNWREAADATFASFLVTPSTGKPWGVCVRDGLLWLEEYPHRTPIGGDITYNGHMFGAFGLWDYWSLTRDARSATLLRGALTTTRDVFSAIRNPGFRSKYCLAHQADSANYHTVHMEQHLDFYAMTGDPVFARMADTYYDDAHPEVDAGTVTLVAGEHVGHRFDANGATTATRRVTLNANSNAPSSSRVRIPGQAGYWYAISAGTLNGYHVREARGRCYQVGVYATLPYPIARQAVVATAPVTAYSIDAAGVMTSHSTDLAVGNAVTLDARAMLNGVEHVRLSSGTYAGRWVGVSTVTRS